MQHSYNNTLGKLGLFGDFIHAWRFKKHESGNSFLGMCVRGSRNLGGSSASFKLSTIPWKNSQTFQIIIYYVVFLFHDPPP